MTNDKAWRIVRRVLVRLIGGALVGVAYWVAYLAAK